MKSYRIEYVGGPIDGTVDRITKSEMVSFVGCVVGKREYLYRFAFRHGKDGSTPLKVKRRYVFQGHKAEMPAEE